MTAEDYKEKIKELENKFNNINTLHKKASENKSLMLEKLLDANNSLKENHKLEIELIKACHKEEIDLKNEIIDRLAQGHKEIGKAIDGCLTPDDCIDKSKIIKGVLSELFFRLIPKNYEDIKFYKRSSINYVDLVFNKSEDKIAFEQEFLLRKNAYIKQIEHISPENMDELTKELLGK